MSCELIVENDDEFGERGVIDNDSIDVHELKLDVDDN
jgi:hypothetical protein